MDSPPVMSFRSPRNPWIGTSGMADQPERLPDASLWVKINVSLGAGREVAGDMATRRSSDASVYAEFVAARSASLFRTAYLVIGDYQLAEDLLQDSLVKVYVAWPRLRDVAKAEALTHHRDDRDLVASTPLLPRATDRRAA